MFKKIKVFLIFSLIVLMIASIGNAENKSKKNNNTNSAITVPTLSNDNTISTMESKQKIVEKKLSPKKLIKKQAYCVQLIPYLKKENADKMVQELTQKSYKPYILTSRQDNQTWYAVRIGDYRNFKSAENAASKFKKQQKIQAFVAYKGSITPVNRNVVNQNISYAPNQSSSYVQLERRIDRLQQLVEQFKAEEEVRSKLKLSKKEKEDTVKQMLSEAGRNYTLLQKGGLGVDYKLTYEYSSSNQLLESIEKTTGSLQSLTVKQQSEHKLTNSLFLQYALLNNLTLTGYMPFISEYSKVGTNDSLKVNDIGDISVGMQWQPLQTGGKLPTSILYSNFTFQTGRSPFEIVIGDDLSTGNGYYSLAGGLSISKALDPVLAFGSMQYSFNFPIYNLDQKYDLSDGSALVLNKVDPGGIFSGSLGIAYSLSYRVSLDVTLQYSYYIASELHWEGRLPTVGGDEVSAVLYVGTGFRITPAQSIFLKLGLGLTSSNSDFSFSLRVPFNF